jgi:hypothetical protein
VHCLFLIEKKMQITPRKYDKINHLELFYFLIFIMILTRMLNIGWLWAFRHMSCITIRQGNIAPNDISLCIRPYDMFLPPMLLQSLHFTLLLTCHWKLSCFVRGFLRVLRLPPLLQIVMVQPTKL